MGVQCEVQPEAGASALEDKVNAVLPLQNKEEVPGIPGAPAVPTPGVVAPAVAAPAVVPNGVMQNPAAPMGP